MLPTLVGGDFVLVRERASVSEGDLVVAKHPSKDLTIVKRIGASGPPIWLISDNTKEGTDSSSFGPVHEEDVVGVVTLVLNRPRQSLVAAEPVP